MVRRVPHASAGPFPDPSHRGGQQGRPVVPARRAWTKSSRTRPRTPTLQVRRRPQNPATQECRPGSPPSAAACPKSIRPRPLRLFGRADCETPAGAGRLPAFSTRRLTARFGCGTGRRFRSMCTLTTPPGTSRLARQPARLRHGITRNRHRRSHHPVPVPCTLPEMFPVQPDQLRCPLGRGPRHDVSRLPRAGMARMRHCRLGAGRPRAPGRHRFAFALRHQPQRSTAVAPA